MKTLLIMRHAKSSWEDSSMSDYERPLNERGIKTSPFIGRVMQENNLQPDSILSSPAKRAMQTALLVKDGGALNAEIVYNDKIYEASPFQLLEIITATPSDINTLMLIGHNPGMEGLLKLLTGETHSIPTAALIKVRLNVVNWEDTYNDCGAIEMFIKPRDEMKASGA
jgi:phosphohistidine phosphatase